MLEKCISDKKNGGKNANNALNLLEKAQAKVIPASIYLLKLSKLANRNFFCAYSIIT